MNLQYSTTSVGAFLCVLVATMLVVPVLAQNRAAQYIPPDFYREAVNENYLYFTNKGQLIDTDQNPRPDLKYYTIQSSPSLYLSKNRISFTLDKIDRDTLTDDTLFRVDMKFTGESVNPSGPRPLKAGRTILNYYKPHIPNGVEQVRGYTRMVYPDVFPSVDMHLYSNKNGAKSSFVVHPGGDPTIIQMSFDGQDQLQIDPYWLKLIMASRQLKLPQAVAYQVDQYDNIIPLSWQPTFSDMGGGAVRFNIGVYDTSKNLIIQMGLPEQAASAGSDEPAWGTYFGHSGHDIVRDGSTDPSGNLYVTGETQSPAFPVTSGVEQDEFGGFLDAFVARFSPAYERHWVTFLGGSNEEAGYGVSFNGGNDALYIVARQEGAGVPPVAFPNAFNQAQGAFGDGCFVASLNPAQSGGQLAWLSHFGGEDIYPNAIATDEDGNTFIAGYIANQNAENTCDPPTDAENFPTCQATPGLNFLQDQHAGGAGAFQPRDGFIARFNSGNALEWSTYFGGSGGDLITGIAVNDATDEVYVVGYTDSPQNDPTATLDCLPPTNGDFPLCDAAGGYVETYINSLFADPADEQKDAFIAKFSIDPTPDLLWSTYFGGLEDDGGSDIAISPAGDVYITGWTANDAYNINSPCLVNASNEFPYCPNGGWTQAAFGGGAFDNFVAGFDANNDIIWSTFLGGDGDEVQEVTGLFPTFNRTPSIAVDEENKVYVTGTTESGSASIPIQDEGYAYFQGDKADGGTVSDGYITGFDASRQLIYSSYFGGTSPGGNGDVPTALVTHSNNRVFVVGSTHSTADFPTFDPGSGAYFLGALHVTNTVPDGFMTQLYPRDWALSVDEPTTSIFEDHPILFPNPSSGMVSIMIPVTSEQPLITVFDVMGHQVQQPITHSGSQQMLIDLTNHAAGLYFVQIRVGEDVYLSKVQIQ